MRVDRHDGSVLKREVSTLATELAAWLRFLVVLDAISLQAFLAPELEKKLGASGGELVGPKPATLGEWKQGLNATTRVCLVDFAPFWHEQ